MDSSAMTWPSSYRDFARALNGARRESELIKEATTPPEDLPVNASYLLTQDGYSGYGVTYGGELIGLFSLVKGRGKRMVDEAVALDGAQYLDCFDGFLPSYYEQFGFVEYKREANWTEGGPDVVYMRLKNVPIPDGGLT